MRCSRTPITKSCLYTGVLDVESLDSEFIMVVSKTLSLERVKMSVKNLLSFFKMVGRLKSVGRSGWISQVGVEEPESVADHSFRCAIMAMCIGDLTNVDSGKLIRMLLLHDVQEALTGDHDAYAKEKIGISTVKAQERNEMKKILSVLPSQLGKRYFSLWDEFENGITDEAILARDIDKLEMLTQALDYEEDGYDPRKLEAFWVKTEKTLGTSIIRSVYELLKQHRERGGH